MPLDLCQPGDENSLGVDTSDSVFPFIIGIIEFTLIAALGSHLLWRWLLILSLIFVAMTWVSSAFFVAGVYLSVSSNQSWFALLVLIVATAALAM